MFLPAPEPQVAESPAGSDVAAQDVPRLTPEEEFDLSTRTFLLVQRTVEQPVLKATCRNFCFQILPQHCSTTECSKTCKTSVFWRSKLFQATTSKNKSPPTNVKVNSESSGRVSCKQRAKNSAFKQVSKMLGLSCQGSNAYQALLRFSRSAKPNFQLIFPQTSIKATI